MNVLECLGVVLVIMFVGVVLFYITRFFVDLYEDLNGLKWEVRHYLDNIRKLIEHVDNLNVHNNTNVHNIIDISERMNKAEDFIAASKEIIEEDTRIFDEFNDEIESINERLDELCKTEKK